ncbi:MAG: S41 family peptidase [Betaproteobacteria bacterium]|nr:S41 family peptidase [Betaproteobacteria bacterium]NBT75365.1 S41 family peptidase [Betaproteobacteria bacterium]NBY13300.1 S41 family peptidase [Betaproteobacteria bacterium]NCA16836.1 S41 family peptidase [Betaproteobacteria bacterium]
MQTKTARWKIASWVGAGLVGGVLISLGLTATAQRESRVALPVDELRLFAEVYGAVKSNYVESVEDKKLITEAISGMLSGLDPHSAYLDAEAFKELQVGTQGEFGGLGIEVGVEDGFVKVVSPIEDTPAERAGVKAGDLIIKIDDRATKGLGLSEAVKLMRGKPKTSITLTIARKGETQPIVLKIERDIIRVQSVKSNWLSPGYAFLRVTQFQEHTVESMVSHLNKLLDQAQKDGSKPVKGVVLDLRNDPGGLLHAAVGVSAAFLQPGVTVVSTDGRLEDSKKSFKAAPDDYRRGGSDPLAGLNPLARSLPMVVLVNAGSASASEIVAGALQDHARAKILGTQTFGKGSVQTILPLTKSTAIKLTTARYYTPSGRSIQATGIRPDFWVEETAEGDVSDRFRLREADLSGHLLNGKEKAGEPKGDRATGSTDKSPNRKALVFGSPEDHQLQQALALLQGKPVATNPAPAAPSK